MKNSSARYTQTTLRVTLKSELRTCPQCQTIYNPHVPDDNKIHELIPRSKSVRIVKEFLDGSRVVELSALYSTNLRIFDSMLHLMNKDLGVDSHLNLEDFNCLVYADGSSNNGVGCCITEVLSKSSVNLKNFRPRILNNGRQGLITWRATRLPSTKENVVEDSSDYYFSDNSPKVLCGVRRIWVSKTHRNKGIASNLLDIARHSLIYSTVIDKHCVAFSEPTPDGADFAFNYMNSEKFIIY